MTRRGIFTALILTGALLSAPLATHARQSTDEMLLRTAQELEKAKGDTKGAIEIYKKLAGSADAKIATAAREQLARLSVSVPAVPMDTTRLPPGILAGTNAGPAVSPDGRWIAAGILVGTAARNTGGIIVRPLDGGPDQRVATDLPGVLRRIRFSPDGLHVAGILWTSRPAGATEARHEESVVVAPSREKGGAFVVIPMSSDARRSEAQERVQDLSWSPDGVWLPIVSNLSGRTEVQLVDVRSGQATPIGPATPDAADFQWSPDGRELAWHVTNVDGAANAIYVFTVASRSTRHIPLARAGGEVTRLGPWTLNGMTVTHLGRNELPGSTRVSLLKLDDGKMTTTCTGFPMLRGEDSGVSVFGGAVDLCLPYSRDGSSQLVWKSQNKRIVVRDVATRADEPLVDGFGEERGVSVSPDAQAVLFASNRDATWALYYTPRATGAAGRPSLLSRLEDVPRFMDVHWGAFGAVVRVSYEEAQVLRVAMDPATGKSMGELAPLTQDSLFNIGPSISPDGQQIAYYSRRNGVVRPAVMRADGSGERVLDLPAVLNYRAGLFWRSPSDFLQQDAADVTGPLELEYRVVDAVSGARRSVGPALGHAGERGSWGFDVRRQEFVYAVMTVGAATALEFRARSLSTGQERVLVSLANPAASLDHFVLSPDGRRLAYLLSTQFDRAMPCEPCELGLINLDTGEVRRFTPPPGPQIPVAFSPGNRFLLYGAAQPRVMDVESGQSWLLMGETAPPRTWYQQGSWAPDGSYIVFAATPGARFISTEWRRFEIKGGGR